MKRATMLVATAAVLGLWAAASLGQATARSDSPTATDGALEKSAAAGNGARDSSQNPFDQRFRGHVLPSKQVVLVAPIEGLIKSIAVKEMQRVKEGELLAQMDDALQTVVLESAKMRAQSDAEVLQSQLAMEEAKINMDRITAAYKEKAASEWEVRRAALQHGQAEAAHTAAKEGKLIAEVNVKLEEQRLARYQLLAPFDGTIRRVHVEPGATLGKTDKAIEIYNLDTLEAQLNLPEQHWSNMTKRIGEEFRLVSELHGELKCTLKTVDQNYDTASHTFRCVFRIDNPETRLPSGFTVYLPWPQ